MLKHLLNENAVVKSVQNVDSYDVPTISDMKNIKCKFEYAVKSDFSAQNSLKNKPARMFCVEEIKIGDIVSFNSENYNVIQVNEYKDLDGKIVLREVFLV